ncbi:DUF6059 family protein [Streptomyces aculeolatus]|uniref:DUF6059 family protein n=1 Tax=Streptomyces aculeolatus TaxID=270689 RepID=UPI001CEC45ED
MWSARSARFPQARGAGGLCVVAGGVRCLACVCGGGVGLVVVLCPGLFVSVVLGVGVEGVGVGRVVGALWRAVVAFGSLYTGPLVYFHALVGPGSEVPPGGLGVGGWGGPPVGHPERLCGDVPLSEGERLLALEVWPEYRSGQQGAGGG